MNKCIWTEIEAKLLMAEALIFFLGGGGQRGRGQAVQISELVLSEFWVVRVPLSEFCSAILVVILSLSQFHNFII